MLESTTANIFSPDFNNIREILQERWCDYTENLLSLSTISIVINTAFELSQRAEKELLPKLPKNRSLGGFKNIADWLFLNVDLKHVNYPAMLKEYKDSKARDINNQSIFSAKKTLEVLGCYVLVDHQLELRQTAYKTYEPLPLGGPKLSPVEVIPYYLNILNPLWVWPDMEALSAIHGPPSNFVDFIQSSNAKDHITEQHNPQGLSWKKKVGMEARLVAEAGGLVSQSVVSEIFLNQYRFDRPKVSVFTLVNIKLLLNSFAANTATAFNPEMPSSVFDYQSTRRDGPSLPFNKVGLEISLNSFLASSPLVSKEYADTKTLSPIAFLSSLTSRLASESILLNFNYITLHQRCTRLLRALYAEFDAEVQDFLEMKEFTEEPREEEFKLLKVAEVILKCFFKQEMEEVTDEPSCLLLRAEKILQPFIEEERDAEIEAVKRILDEGSVLNFNSS
ncbi:hypothetical protein G7Y89_g9573 [Cudoniella acicularis]|uniref:DUF6604 domain-containing protein n=1 Tax=Cudoniella acicularis TaxID=354080 RepID=A0A8H4REE1_9HELO|nr:hypothetical protein G7Y89_g9573 [Cudoniella acicularis]